MLLLRTKNIFKNYLFYFNIDQILNKKKDFKNNSYVKSQEDLYLVLLLVFPISPAFVGQQRRLRLLLQMSTDSSPMMNTL